MSELQDWHKLARSNVGNHTWFCDNMDAIYELIKKTIYHGPYFQDAIDLFLFCAPYFLSCKGRDRWLWILMDSLNDLYILRDVPRQIQVWQQIGRFSVVNGEAGASHNAFDSALDRAQKLGNEREAIKARVGLLKLQMYHYTEHDADGTRSQLLDVVHHVDRELKALIYDTLASYHLHRGEVSESIAYSSMAYAIWSLFNDEPAKGRSLLTMALSARVARQLQLAKRYHEMIQIAAPEERLPQDMAVSHYELAVLLYQENQYEAALNLLREAERELAIFEYPYYSNMIRHTIGLILIELSQFGDAHNSLSTALSNWQMLRNGFEEANTCHALGYLERRRQNKELALKWLNDGLNRLNQISVSPLRTSLAERIQDELNRTNSG